MGLNIMFQNSFNPQELLAYSRHMKLSTQDSLC